MGYQPSDAKEGLFSQLITKPKDLFRFFEDGFKKPEDVRIGMEVEKHGIYRSNYRPVSYFGKNSFRKIQEKLMEELDWKVELREGRYIFAMSRGGSQLHLESSQSMSELAGRTHPSIHDLARELHLHLHELSEISKLFDVVWLGIGFQPFTKTDELKLVKIHRYEIATAQENGGKLKPTIWDHIASVQANIDYVSAEDAIRKFQILLRLAPFLSAMYAHSPLQESKTTGFVSNRLRLFREADPERTGVRKFFYASDFTLQDWLDFCLKIPMRAIFRDGKWIPVHGLTFFQFLHRGWDIYIPKMEDFVLHLSYIYTDVRVRQFIELRVCDSLPPALIPSMQAVTKAFVYHDDGMKFLKDLTKQWTYHDFVVVIEKVAKDGMDAEIRGKKLLEYCKEILNFASTSLASFAVLDEKGRDESVHLEPIKDFVFVKGKCPGKWVMDNWDGDWKQNSERLIEWCSFT